MTITASTWPATSVQSIEDVLVQCAQHRLWMGTSDEVAQPYTATRARVAFQDYRTGLAAPMTNICLQPGQDENGTAQRTTQHTNDVEVYLCWPIDHTGAATEKQQSLKALNEFGSLLDQLAALIGTGTNLAKAAREWEPPHRTADNDHRPGCWAASITFRWVI